MYIISGTPTGDWSTDGQAANDLALYSELDWIYITPPASADGLTVYVQSKNTYYKWNGTSWNPVSHTNIQLFPGTVEYTTAVASTVNNHDVLLFESVLGSSSSSAGVLLQDAVWKAYAPKNYSENGLTVEIFWTANTTTGNVLWEASIESLSEGDAIDSDSFGTIVESDVIAAPTTARQIRKSTITLSDGAETDSVSADELMRVKISRDITHASDTMTAADAELLSVNVFETGTN